jgi:polysaccharide export outer membrane protein
MKSRIDSSLVLCVGFLFLFLSSCITQKDITYFQQRSDTLKALPFDTTFVTVIHPNDIINIFVTSLNTETSKYFNFSERPEGMRGQDVSSPGPNGYLVDAFGFIQLPFIGSVKVGGLTSSAARDTIIERLGKFFEEPTVKLNIQNFRVTFLGEVARPGVYYISSEKMSLMEGLASAGDLTFYGRRNNITVIREENGKKTFALVDISARDFFSSPYYNLHSNDIVYVEPFKQKKFQIQIWWKVLPIVLSTVSLGLVIYELAKP